MQRWRTAFFVFKSQGEKAVNYALSSLHQPEHAKRKGGVKMRKRILLRERDPCILRFLLSPEKRMQEALWRARCQNARVELAGGGRDAGNAFSWRRMRIFAMRPRS
jgi:hypothetical protein